jgi:trehalose synthase
MTEVQQTGLEYSLDGKTIQLPLENGIVYCPSKGIRPTSNPFSAHSLDEYVPIIGEEEARKLESLAQEFKGIKILELNSTASGGGVAEMLYSSIPFLNSLGIEDEWKVIKGSDQYYEATKNIHNILQGKECCFTPEMEEIYSRTVRENAEAHNIDWNPDVIFVHDPQPLGLAPYLKKEGETWFWRCHIDIEDTLNEGSAIWDFMSFLTKHYNAAIFSAAHYVIARWPIYTFIIPPFIDPLSEKNRDLTPEEVDAVLKKHQIDPKVPIISQIGRFDPWKGIGRTIQTYRRVKSDENCQLILAGGSASDDPEGERVLSEVYEQTKDDPDIHVLNLPPQSHMEINALQRASWVIMQPSIKEGFGLTVTEALFKEKPVIASPVGGIPMQLRDGETGYFYDTPSLSAQKIVFLLRNPSTSESMGKKGKEYVVEHFMLPCRIADHLRAIGDIRYGKRYTESIISYHPWYKMNKRK